MCFVIPADLIQSLRYKGSRACVIPLNTCPVERSPQSARASSDSGKTASVLVFLVTMCIHQPPSAPLIMFSHCRRMMSLMRSPVRQEKRAADFTTGFSHGVLASIFTSSSVRNSRRVLASLACFSRVAILSLMRLSSYACRSTHFSLFRLLLAVDAIILVRLCVVSDSM